MSGGRKVAACVMLIAVCAALVTVAVGRRLRPPWLGSEARFLESGVPPPVLTKDVDMYDVDERWSVRGSFAEMVKAARDLGRSCLVGSDGTATVRRPNGMLEATIYESKAGSPLEVVVYRAFDARDREWWNERWARFRGSRRVPSVL